MNIKCAIGATILAPLAVAGVFAAIIGFEFATIWVFSNSKYAAFAVVGVIVIVFLAGAWVGFYQHCVDRKKSR